MSSVNKLFFQNWHLTKEFEKIGGGFTDLVTVTLFIISFEIFPSKINKLNLHK